MASRKKESGISLKVKVPMFISLLVMLALAGSSVSFYWVGSNLLLDKSKDEMKANADRIGEGIYSSMELELQSTYLISLHETFRDLLKVRDGNTLSNDRFFSSQNQLLDQSNQILATSLTGTKGHNSFTLIDAKGTIVASSTADSVGADRSDREYFQEALKGDAVISDAIFSKSTGKLIVVFAYPVKDDDGNVLGVYISTVDASFFVGKLENIKINERGKIYIVDRKGTVIFHTGDPSLSGSKIEEAEIVGLTEKKAAQEILQGEIDLDEKYLRYSKIPSANWTIVVEDDYADIKQPLQKLLWNVVIVTVAALTVTILVGLYGSGYITKPIIRLTKLFQELSSGNLDVTIDIKSKDEIGTLASAFRQMGDNLNEVMGNIQSASEQVAAGSNQLSASSMALSQGATEQASAVEQLTASLEEISSQTKLNADNATQANTLAEEARENAVQGNERMKEMLKAMDDINDASGSISKIIKVIDEIAFQTNILALNAAVEAARAGQHGKGFAVVAEEVRNLAARSAGAAKETTDLIEGSIKKVEGGSRIANDTAAALTKIVDGVAKVANLVSDIAVASNEQAIGVAQINQGITQVAQVVQTNSATSEESAAASEELSSQAEMMQAQVGRFKLRKAAQSLSYLGLEELSPDVIRMLESMSEKNRTGGGADDSYSEVATAGTTKIALSDKEFGKY
ncbi:methyl-accepting chemotaxis protein [Cohnella sp.]|uniref:methyl-accepting chemotaxis protein n=1 Tax=Cohnella sp. TaxID=1883426 RepID=UPI0035691409